MPQNGIETCILTQLLPNIHRVCIFFYKKRCLLLHICASIFTSNGLAGRLLFLAISPATNAYSSGALKWKKNVKKRLLLLGPVTQKPQKCKFHPNIVGHRNIPGSSSQRLLKRMQIRIDRWHKCGCTVQMMVFHVWLWLMRRWR